MEGASGGMGGAEKRRYVRRAVQFPVRYRLSLQGMITEWKESTAGNVSAGGLFMTSGEEVKQGAELDLEFTIPGHRPPIRATGRVAWVNVVVPKTMVQCGLEFSGLTPEDRAFLEEFSNKSHL